MESVLAEFEGRGQCFRACIADGNPENQYSCTPESGCDCLDLNEKSFYIDTLKIAILYYSHRIPKIFLATEINNTI